MKSLRKPWWTGHYRKEILQILKKSTLFLKLPTYVITNSFFFFFLRKQVGEILLLFFSLEKEEDFVCFVSLDDEGRLIDDYNTPRTRKQLMP